MFGKKWAGQVLGGCMRDYPKYAVGNYKGYYISMWFDMNNRYYITINAYSANDEGNVLLSQFLETKKKDMKQLLEVETFDKSVCLTIQGPALAKNLVVVINDTVNVVTDYLINGMYESGCDCCGTNTETLECYNINGGYHQICHNCSGTIENALQQNREAVKAQKSNLVPGLIGAFLGALIGCALWVVIYRLGYIAGLAGAVTGVCALRGYAMFGKHLDRKGVVASVIVMFLMIFFANKISWAWVIYDVYKADGFTFSEVYRLTDEIIAYSEATAEYYMDLIIGYVLTILASFSTIVGAFKASGGSYSIKKEK